MQFPMPLEPPLKPDTVLASIILIVHAETLPAPGKLLPGPLHHVLVVFRSLIYQECDGGERSCPWLSTNALGGVFTFIAAALSGGRYGEGDFIPRMDLVEKWGV